VELAAVAEDKPEQLVAWLLRLAKKYGTEVIVTDNLFSYPVLANELKLQRQVCRFYALRWMMLALKECETTLV
jgi:hypothetical protein